MGGKRRPRTDAARRAAESRRELSQRRIVRRRRMRAQSLVRARFVPISLIVVGPERTAAVIEKINAVLAASRLKHRVHSIITVEQLVRMDK